MEEGAIAFYGALFFIIVGFVVLGRYVRRWWGEWQEYQDYVAYAADNYYADGAGAFDDHAEAEPANMAPLLHAGQWAAFLNNQPDQVPHVWLFGPTGSGKTSFVCALLGSRGGSVLVITPKLKTSDWSGATVVSVDDAGSYAPIERAFEALEAEKQRRITALRSEQRLDPLTVVLDEQAELVAECKAAGPFVRRMGNMGREIKIRVVVLSQYDSVKAGGIEGHGGARANYARVALAAAQPGQPREGTLTWGDRQYLLDLSEVPVLAARARLRGWMLPPVAQPEQSLQPRATGVVGSAMEINGPEDLLLRQPIPAESEPPSLQQQIVQQHNWADIARLIKAGATTQTKALAALGYKASSTNPRYAAAREALQAALAALEETVEVA
jgi:hypothetical protein